MKNNIRSSHIVIIVVLIIAGLILSVKFYPNLKGLLLSNHQRVVTQPGGETSKSSGLSEYANRTDTSLQSQELEEKLAPVLKKVKGHYSLAYKSLTDSDQLVIQSRQMPSASVIKIFIMAAAYSEAKYGRINLDETILLKESDKVGGTGVLQSQSANTALSIRNLILLMVSNSDNTATNILIDKLGMNTINNYIQAMGCQHTVLQRKMMDTVSASQGRENYTSVSDLVNVLEKIYANRCVGPDYDGEMLSILKQQKQRNLIPRNLPASCTIANKPGNLPGIVNDAALIYTEQGAYVLCILSQDVQEARMNEVIPELSQIVYEYHVNEDSSK